MRISITLAIGLMACLSSLGSVWGDSGPTYNNGVLVIPSVSTDGQVGQYQEAVLNVDAEGRWQLGAVRVLDGSPLGVYRTPVAKVEAVKTAGTPVQVLLRVSGEFSSGCGMIGRVSQRRVGNRFEVLLADGFFAYEIVGCTGIVQPYVKIIPLEVYGLGAGVYTYDVNGKTGSFEFAADNVLPGDCFGSAACRQ